MKKIQKFLIPIIVVAAIAAAAFYLTNQGSKKHLTAEFPRALAIYEGSEVRILGVPVGKVETVDPQGDTVRVKMSYDSKYKVPADAKAAIILPAVVGDRFVQLTPVYQGGAQLEDNALLECDVSGEGECRTTAPVELDELYKSLDELLVATGPQGANKNGALADVLKQTARNFGGQGAAFKQTIKDFSTLSTTLDNNKEELFGTVAQVEEFVSTLAENDSTVREFNQSLAQVSDLLADERQDLADALGNLGTAMQEVRGFVAKNRASLTRNVSKLKDVVSTVVKRRDSLEEILHVAPLALNNLGGTYNPQAGTLDTRPNLDQLIPLLLKDPLGTLCNTIGEGADAVCDLLGGLLPRTAPGKNGTGGVPYYKEYVDPTLGGLVKPEGSAS